MAAAKKSSVSPAKVKADNNRADPAFVAICERQPQALAARYEDKKLSRSWQIGRRKAFAIWHFDVVQPGPHVRTNDPAVRADPRVKPSIITVSAMEKKNNFVWLDPASVWSKEEWERLIVASAQLATRKDGGVKRGGDFADLFIVLRKALVATPEPMRSPPPHHAGGPAAKIVGNEGPTLRALALWAAQQLSSEVLPDEQERHARALDLAAKEKANYQSLWSAAYEKGGSRALRAARAAQLAHGSMAGGYETRASSYAAEAVCLVLERKIEEGDGEKVRAFLEEIDDRVLNAELAAVARERLEREDVMCERVLWRGADAKGNAGTWVARLGENRYVLLAKIGPRWQWLEGSRDDVLASVPDSDFANATAITFARDRPGTFGVGAVVKNPRWAYRKKK